jgi:PAS domain S-box-containing protein
MAQDLGKVHLETLLAHTRLAVAASDASGRMTLFSPALEELFGAPFEDVHEAEMVEAFDLYAADGTTPLRTEDIPLVRARHGEVVTDAVLTARRHDGEVVYLRCNAAPLRGEDDEIVGAVVLVQDVTTEHAAQQEQDELRERLVVTINHELRTPLTKLLGHAEILAEHRDDLPPHLRKSADVIVRSADALQDIAELISALADLESHARLTKTFGSMSALLRDCLESTRARAAARGLDLREDLPQRLHATVDPDEVQRAVCALLDNAVAYAPEGTAIDLRLSADRAWVRIDVCDHGSGIPPQDRARLIEPFERGDHPLQPVNSRGLGLTLAHTIATAHGGELVLDDHEPGGLCASLRLPRYGTVSRPIRGPGPDGASDAAGRQGA